MSEASPLFGHVNCGKALTDISSISTWYERNALAQNTMATMKGTGVNNIIIIPCIYQLHVRLTVTKQDHILDHTYGVGYSSSIIMPCMHAQQGVE